MICSDAILWSLSNISTEFRSAIKSIALDLHSFGSSTLNDFQVCVRDSQIALSMNIRLYILSQTLLHRRPDLLKKIVLPFRQSHSENQTNEEVIKSILILVLRYAT